MFPKGPLNRTVYDIVPGFDFSVSYYLLISSVKLFFLALNLIGYRQFVQTYELLICGMNDPMTGRGAASFIVDVR